MIIIQGDKSVSVTRGDIAVFSVSAAIDGERCCFAAGDIVRIKVFEKKNAENVVLQKDFGVEEETESVTISLTSKDTKIGGIISKPVDYWYEIELNPLTDPQTIVGYDEDGAKIFRLFPEGRDLEPVEPEEEDIPIVDPELDLISTRPVQNRAIARRFAQVSQDIIQAKAAMTKDVIELADSVANIAVDDGNGCFYRMVGGVKEWLNPPMEDDVKYRTTERYNGKPVYVWKFKFPRIPGGDTGTTADVAEFVQLPGDVQVISMEGLHWYDFKTEILPTFTPVGTLDKYIVQSDLRRIADHTRYPYGDIQLNVAAGQSLSDVPYEDGNPYVECTVKYYYK